MFEINSNAWIWHVDGEENREAAVQALTDYEDAIAPHVVNIDRLTTSWLATYPLERDTADIRDQWRECKHYI